MKTKKVVVGTMTAALLSLTLSALPITFAAGETVQISVGSEEVKPGDEFSVDVVLTDIPSTGIQGCDFAVSYDNTIITITSVEAGALTETGASEADSTASLIPNFESYILNDKGCVNITWSTSLSDSQYWLQGSGVFCTITGTVSSSAANGTTTDLKLIPISRDSYPDSGTSNAKITAGYVSGSKTVKYDVVSSNGTITISVPVTTAPTTEAPTAAPTTAAPTAAPTTAAPATVAPTVAPTTTAPATDVLYGDADCNGSVEISDAVRIMSYTNNTIQYPLSEQGLNNADVYNRGDGLNNMDALAVQKRCANVLSELPESYQS
jgi:hypothetical protein